MSRKTHVRPEERVEDICQDVRVELNLRMREFLDTEAKRLSEAAGRRYTAQDVIRALVAAYREKRVMYLIIDPDD